MSQLKELFSVNWGNNEVPTFHEVASRFFVAGELTQKYYEHAPVPQIPFAYEKFVRYYKSVNLDGMVVELWNAVLLRIEEEVRLGNSDLLKLPIIANAVFSISSGAWERASLKYLERRCSEGELLRLLPEDPPLQPVIFCEKYSCSETTAMHLAQLEFYSEKMKARLEDMRCIAEFGAGYGSMTRLMRKMNADATLVVIDLPIMLILQHYYLANIFGEQRVNLILTDGGDLRRGAINLVPVTYCKTLAALPAFSPDLFVACYSLSEATDRCQQFVYDEQFFGAKDLLLSYYYKDLDVIPFSTHIRVPDSFEICYDGPVIYSTTGDQLHKFARRKQTQG